MNKNFKKNLKKETLDREVLKIKSRNILKEKSQLQTLALKKTKTQFSLAFSKFYEPKKRTKKVELEKRAFIEWLWKIACN